MKSNNMRMFFLSTVMLSGSIDIAVAQTHHASPSGTDPFNFIFEDVWDDSGHAAGDNSSITFTLTNSNTCGSGNPSSLCVGDTNEYTLTFADDAQNVQGSLVTAPKRLDFKGDKKHNLVWDSASGTFTGDKRPRVILEKDSMSIEGASVRNDMMVIDNAIVLRGTEFDSYTLGGTDLGNNNNIYLRMHNATLALEDIPLTIKPAHSFEWFFEDKNEVVITAEQNTDVKSSMVLAPFSFASIVSPRMIYQDGYLEMTGTSRLQVSGLGHLAFLSALPSKVKDSSVNVGLDSSLKTELIFNNLEISGKSTLDIDPGSRVLLTSARDLHASGDGVLNIVNDVSVRMYESGHKFGTLETYQGGTSAGKVVVQSGNSSIEGGQVKTKVVDVTKGGALVWASTTDSSNPADLLVNDGGSIYIPDAWRFKDGMHATTFGAFPTGSMTFETNKAEFKSNATLEGSGNLGANVAKISFTQSGILPSSDAGVGKKNNVIVRDYKKPGVLRMKGDVTYSDTSITIKISPTGYRSPNANVVLPRVYSDQVRVDGSTKGFKEITFVLEAMQDGTYTVDDYVKGNVHEYVIYSSGSIDGDTPMNIVLGSSMPVGLTAQISNRPSQKGEVKIKFGDSGAGNVPGGGSNKPNRPTGGCPCPKPLGPTTAEKLLTADLAAKQVALDAHKAAELALQAQASAANLYASAATSALLAVLSEKMTEEQAKLAKENADKTACSATDCNGKVCPPKLNTTMVKQRY